MNVAFIPVRGGSKSIPLKNIREIAGKPLVYWVVKAACECGAINRVYVATDSGEIRNTVEGFRGENESLFGKVVVIGRSAESASDTASTESAMLEFAKAYEFDNIVLIQATSPLLRGEDLDRGFEAFFSEGTDSVLSVVPQKRFRWQRNEAGFAVPVNYDVFHRPRRQEFDGDLVENGAFYITSREDLIRTGNRVSGNIRAVEMDEDSYFEVDEPGDWVVIEALLKRREKKGKAVPEIKMLLTDCDGCLTDGGMIYTEKGDELKKFNTRDGVAFSILRKKGILTGIVTGEKVELNCRRAEKIKADILIDGCENKYRAVLRLCEERGIALENVCYVGDEINDLEMVKAAGFGCCPADAAAEVREVADYVSPVKGGDGVIRDVVRKLGITC